MTSPLTVVQLLPALDSGGVERGTLEVNRALCAAGHRSLVISGGGRLVRQIEADGGEHICMPVGKKSARVLTVTTELRNWIRKTQPDLLHARSRLPAWITWLALKSLPAKQRPQFITTVHGLNSPGFYSSIMTRSSRIIAVSETARNHILQHYPRTPQEKITLIPRGVDPAEFPWGFQPSAEWQTSWYQQFPQLRGQFVACLPGRVTRLKGHADLFQALASLKKRGVTVFGLVVGGEDPQRQAYAESLRQLAADLDIDERIVFAGHRPDIREVLSVSDAVVSVTSHPPESFGRAVLESVRLGRITLGYDHGGVGEVLGNVFPAGRIALGNIEMLAQRLQDVYDGKIAKPERGNQYTLDDMLQKELLLYSELCGRREIRNVARAA